MTEQVTNAISYFRNIILDKLDCNCWVAGGAVRDYFSIGRVVSDIDIFFINQEEYTKADIKLATTGCSIINDSENARMYKKDKEHPIHLIRKYFYKSPSETINNFDYTVCCAAISKDEMTTHETFFMDLARKRLVINQLPFPVSSLQRMQKYIKKGYSICNGGILQLAKAMAGVDFGNKNQNVLEFYPDGTPRFKRID